MSDDLSIPRTPVYRATRARPGLDPMTRRLMWIAGGLAVLLAGVTVLWSATGNRGGPVPVVQADQQPVRVKPDHPGGMQIPGLSAETGPAAGGTSAGRLAPAPETPNPQALASQLRAAAPPRPPAAVPAPPAAAAAPLAAKPAPLAAPLAATAIPPRGATATVVPESRVAAAHDATATPAPGPAGQTQVQLAAVGSEAAARHEWDRLAHRMPDVLGARHPTFSKIEHAGHTLWRVRTGTFGTEAEASQFCQKVRAKGAGCMVAAF